METTTITTTTTTITHTTTTTSTREQEQQQQSKLYMMSDQKDLFQLLVIIFIDYFYRIFITRPISIIKNYSRHPLSITLLFLFLFPIYLFIQFIISFISFVSRFFASKRQGSSEFIKHFFGGQTVSDATSFIDHQHHTTQQPTRRDEEEQEEDDDMQQWLERCSICFESKLDLCLDYCRDQFCLNCFQKYVSEVVKSSWGLCVTKIRCPVCRVYIPQSEWTKFVSSSIVELYNKFNRPYRSFSRSCPHCEKEVIPCDFVSHAKAPSSSFAASFCGGSNSGTDTTTSKTISNLIQQYFTIANTHCTLEQRSDHILPPLSYQQHLVKVFSKSEWRNSTLPDIHHQLMTKLIQANVIIDQLELVKRISREILQLDVRPDTWRRLQFDHISFFSNISCPHCEKPFCLKCGHNNIHDDLTCQENMKQIIERSKADDDESIQTLKWKLENSRNCPSCSIMINRDEGCNKVDCTLCGFSFCWECKSTWSDGCGFFNCLVKSKEKAAAKELQNKQEDEGFVYSAAMFEQGSSTAAVAVTSNGSSGGSASNRTELGVPNIDMIHSRLNNTNNN